MKVLRFFLRIPLLIIGLIIGLIPLSKFINKTIIAMSAWLKKAEDKTYALVGGAGVFVSEELPVT